MHRRGSARLKVCWKCGASVADAHRFCMQCGADQTRTEPAPDPFIGKVLADKYRIQAQIGSGAMGTIYKAEQTALSKTVAIKVLHKHLMGDAELLHRFEREARAASRLNHPNCVQITDFGSLSDGSMYIAMEFIAGIDLADLIERQFPLDHGRVIRIAKQICSALDEAHANGVLHRDLKPENIMLEDRRNAPDHVKVVDFGIAKLEDGAARSKRSFQTRAGIVCGTPEYMSPEQARGEKLDARSDIYALGVLLYHVVTDRLPFEGKNPIETVTKHLNQAPDHPSQFRPDLPEPFGELIMTMLAKNREHRPPSVLDVSAELSRIERELIIHSVDHSGGANNDKTAVDIRPISALIDLIDLTTPDSPPVSITMRAPAPPPPQKAAAPRTLSGTPAAPALKAKSSVQAEPTGELDRAAITRLGERPLGPNPSRSAPGAGLQDLETVNEKPALSAFASGPSSALLRRGGNREIVAGGSASGLTTRGDPLYGPDTELNRDNITHQALPSPEDALKRRGKTTFWVTLGVVLAGGTVVALLLI